MEYLGKNYIEKLKEVQEIIDSCDGDSNSILCSNCPCTDYGVGNNYYISPTGYHSCEGSRCNKAIENIEDELICKYNKRKEELEMDNAKMKMEIDLDILEQNIMKMAVDKIGYNIENNVVKIITSKIQDKVEKQILDKLNKTIDNKINDFTANDIYNIKVKSENGEISLFDFMVKHIIENAINKNIEFNSKIDEILKSIEYIPVDDNFDDDEFKILTTYEKDKYGVNSINIEINDKEVFYIGEGEVEDMTFNRNLNDIMRVPDIIKKAYLAGKDGKVMYMAENTLED